MRILITNALTYIYPQFTDFSLLRFVIWAFALATTIRRIAKVAIANIIHHIQINVELAYMEGLRKVETQRITFRALYVVARPGDTASTVYQLGQLSAICANSPSLIKEKGATNSRNRGDKPEMDTHQTNRQNDCVGDSGGAGRLLMLRRYGEVSRFSSIMKLDFISRRVARSAEFYYGP